MTTQKYKMGQMVCNSIKIHHTALHMIYAGPT